MRREGKRVGIVGGSSRGSDEIRCAPTVRGSVGGTGSRKRGRFCLGFRPARRPQGFAQGRKLWRFFSDTIENHLTNEVIFERIDSELCEIERDFGI
jgi:hypothetical protein